jgi:CTP:molybdopterin cytidylyltransferase MocA
VNTHAPVAGLLLAAGSGRRFGGPKALVEIDGEPLLVRALRTLTESGCAPVRVVLGAGADAARALLPDPAIAVYAEDWATGLGASLRTGLDALRGSGADAVLVHLVDLPWVRPEVLSRVAESAAADVVARAGYGGEPGHPVLLGRRWWAEVAETVRGDRGARDWLAGRQDLRLVECGDLGSGKDIDAPADLNPWPSAMTTTDFAGRSPSALFGEGESGTGKTAPADGR